MRSPQTMESDAGSAQSKVAGLFRRLYGHHEQSAAYWRDLRAAGNPQEGRNRKQPIAPANATPHDLVSCASSQRSSLISLSTLSALSISQKDQAVSSPTRGVPRTSSIL